MQLLVNLELGYRSLAVYTQTYLVPRYVARCTHGNELFSQPECQSYNARYNLRTPKY